jgi:hypothetical protein
LRLYIAEISIRDKIITIVKKYNLLNIILYIHNKMITVDIFNLSLFLDNMIKNNNDCKNNYDEFYLNMMPNVSIDKYLKRLVKYLNCDCEIIILALIYVDKLIDRSEIKINKYNAHKIILMSIAMASKYIDDNCQTNKYISSIGGISCEEFNKLELKFLNLLNYNLFVYDDIFDNYKRAMLRRKLLLF